MVEQFLAFEHHGNTFGGESFSGVFSFDTTIASRQKHAELASRAPVHAIGTEDQATYSLPCVLDDIALRCF